MNNEAFLEKLDATVEVLSVRLAELVRSAGTERGSSSADDAGGINDAEDSAEGGAPMLSNATQGSMMVHSQSAQLVKGVQDLLVLTRGLRERWLLNQLPERVQGDSDKIDTQLLESLLDKCIQSIAGAGAGATPAPGAAPGAIADASGQ
ncbi:Srb6p KNAG_0L01080 [Huiozyma naganishii CBS 8797]|uniref:Mediator complex subunit 22 n=1 Tax=Huiozyma naganishii (strain ATCC MYA-139 / BCRC 22969 / CBS 8797 / KCTC 17520 / NBRC 10181 / NCYC 3082 / Yp74L-3) TaxID=1071383 RepID=J7SAG4_HUIN7|nr:hypothetical protein KNAG_0L01080 [Kazachstania naganishii CBS 8797]CCK72729.1 hypothetical protein KNAG_0L01080 [Kazachstania naganishii CBS 8797]